jgi:aldose 1-epimerase
MNYRLAALLGLLAAAAPATEMQRSIFTHTADGQPVEVFTLTNENGLRARVITWGASLISLEAPDRTGQRAEVTLGFDEPARYLAPHPFFGCIAGRYANRIALGQFTLDGKLYQLPTNNGRHHLHGGPGGFDKRHWAGQPVPGGVRFTYVSAAGEEGYPGKLTATVTYTLTEANELRLDYTATTDAPTVVNLTNHAYWNLGSEADVLGHELRLAASRYTVVDAESIPTGELRPVADTPFDFTTAKPIGRDLAQVPGGYDHNWVLDAPPGGGLALAAELFEPKSGRVLRVLTDQPGVQFYTGNYLKNVAGRGGRSYGPQAGLCLETQHFPDSPNHPAFPSTVLRPGETYRTTTVHAFSVR